MNAPCSPATGPHNFALIGAGGFVAPRHLRAIRDTGNCLVAATDPHDAVGVLDQYSFDVRFFTEIERFDRHLEKLRRAGDAHKVHYVSICSPNYLHDAHVRLALRVGAHAICEKPLVITPWNLDALEEIERETGRRIFTVLQLRLHPALLRLRDRLAREPGRVHDVVLTYVTARGRWYDVSWKGDEQRSGGIATNIGVHFFDMLVWLFGTATAVQVHLRERTRMAGTLRLQQATVRWFLSTNLEDVSSPTRRSPSFRSITVDGEEVDFTDGFVDLHTRLYEEVLAGRGFGVADARPSIELTHRIRLCPLTAPGELAHPRLTQSDLAWTHAVSS